MDADTFSELLTAYVLDALSDEERAAVEAYLATSPEAQEELRTYQSMLAGFARLVPYRQAPAHLTEDFKRRLAAEAVTPSALPVQPSRPTSTPVIIPTSAPAPASTPIQATVSSWWRVPTARRLMLGIAAVIIVAIGVLVVWRSQSSNPEDSQIRGILSNPVAMVVTLNPAGTAQGKVSFVTVPNDTKAVVVADLPALPAGKQYQLWLIKDSTMDSIAVFDANQSSSKQMLLTLTKPASQYAAVGLTVEPAGGSPAPTTSPIFVGNLD